MTLRTCERCGASLDPEERCDCEEHEAQNDECKVEEDGDGQLGFDMPKPPPRPRRRTYSE